jgi:hypothetical protein
MAPPRRYESNAERQAAYRERKRAELEQEGLPERGIEEDVERPSVVDAEQTERSIEMLLALDPLAPLSEEEEQAVRDHFGFGASETRTRAERELAARKVREKVGEAGPGVAAAVEQLAGEQARHERKLAAYRTGLKKD